MKGTISIEESRLQTLLKRIGRTPMVDLSALSPHPQVKIMAKAEWFQLGGSVKARAAFSMITEAIRVGQWKQGKTLLDATSGNTGIAYAAIGAATGIPVSLCLPENASQERKNILKALGATLILTSPFDNTDGAQREAALLASNDPEKYVYLDQYSNPANWQAHYQHTAREIWQQTDGEITHFVTGLGTSGSFMGSIQRLKEYNAAVVGVALQPESILHGLEGWKHMPSAKVPAFYDSEMADVHETIDSLDALRMMKRLAREEGLMVSPSSAANVVGALRVASRLEEGTVVTLLPDDASKYGEVWQQIEEWKL